MLNGRDPYSSMPVDLLGRTGEAHLRLVRLSLGTLMAFLDALRRNSAPDRTILVAGLKTHFDQWFGPGMFQSHLGDSFIEIRSVEPNERFPFRILHTVGMASRALKTKKGEEPLAELMMVLPTEWSYGSDPDWPGRQMRRYAGMFHEMCAGMAEFTAIPFASHPSPEPGTPFTGLMAVRPHFVPPAAHKVDLPSGHSIKLFALMPLSLVEMKYIATQSEPDALWALAREQRRDPLELILADIRRPSVA